VEQVQSTYVDALQAYELAKRRRGSTAFARFLTRLSDLRSVAVEHSNLLEELEAHNSTDIPTLVKECYVLPPEGS
jgi:hypothetical protein